MSQWMIIDYFEHSRREVMSTTGEKPGMGAYKCKKCGEIILLNDEVITQNLLT